MASQGRVHVTLRITQFHLPHHTVRKTQLAMRPCANAQIVTKLPVVGVVKALVAVARIGRDFITRHAMCARHGGDTVQHVVGLIVLRDDRRKLGKVGVGLNRQVVNRDVRRLEAQRRLQILDQIRLRLPRQGIHDVEVEGLKRCGGLLHGSPRLLTVVHTPQGG